MKTKALLDQVKSPESVDELLELVRCGAGVKVDIKPRLHLDKKAPDRNHPSFRLCGLFTVRIGDRMNSFEKTYAKGHEVQPAKGAANGFVIANTRLFRDVKKMRRAGIRCEAENFVLSQMLPDVDLAELDPHRPYTINQFALLAGIGCPLQISMTTFTRVVMPGSGAPEHELCALYSINYEGRNYQVETRHGGYPRGADRKEIEKMLEWARNSIVTEEQYNLRRVGVEIQMGPLWQGDKDTKFSSVPTGFVAGEEAKEDDHARPSLRAV